MSTLDKAISALSEEALKQQEPHEMDAFSYTEGFVEGFRLAMVAANNSKSWVDHAAVLLEERKEYK